jgi:hypothetical protein
VNGDQLEALVQRQRCQLVFAQAMYDQLRKENLRLREIILQLRKQLEGAGIAYESFLPPPDIESQPLLPLIYETVTTQSASQQTAED